MTAVNQTSFSFDAEAESLPSLLTQSDWYVAQRDLAISKIRQASDHLITAYQLSREAISSVQVLTQTEDYVFRYSHNKNDDYSSLFNDRFEADKAIEAFRKTVDSEIWGKLIAATGIESLMDHQALKAFRAQLASDVPEVTQDNLRATLETLYGQREDMFLRGVANVFSALDRRFKSHDAFKCGSRIVMENILPYGESGFCAYSSGAERLNDIDRVVRKILSLKDCPGYLSARLAEAQGPAWRRKQLFFENDYIKIRVYLNGNAHCYLSEVARVGVNKALASFYGDVLPDAAPADVTEEQFVARHVNLPSKDLAFYSTPDAVADKAASYLHLSKGDRVLEPTAGTGALIRALKRKIAETSNYREEYRITDGDITVDAVEIHPARCQILRATEGSFCSVTTANFLSMTPHAIYDAILINPPFHGTHCLDFVRHAFDFMKDDGVMVVILPITAALGQTPRHQKFHRWLDKTSSYEWHDLPTGSFAESGTMISTTILKLRKI